MDFDNFVEAEKFEEFFERGARWERDGQFLEGVRVFRDSNHKFYFSTLFHILFICRLKDIVSLVIFNLRF